MNRQSGSLASLTLVLVVTACGGGSGPRDDAGVDAGDETGPGPVDHVELVRGQWQTAPPSTELPEPIVGRVVDSEGRAIQGQLVNFVVTQGGGSVFAGTAVSDADGLVQERWTVGTSMFEDQRLEVRIVDSTTGAAKVLATFGAYVHPGALEEVSAVWMDDVVQPLRGGEAITLLVRALDAHSNPIPDVEVQWSITQGGVAAGATSATQGNGVATMQVTLPETISQPVTGTATVQGSVRPFTFRPGEGKPYAFVDAVTDCYAGAPGSRPARPPMFRVVDPYGTRLAWQEVTLTVVEGGGYIGTAGVAEKVVTTNESGGPYASAAQSDWVLGPQPGMNRLRARIANGAELDFSVESQTLFAKLESATASAPSKWGSTVSVVATICRRAGNTTPPTVTIADATVELQAAAPATQPCGFAATLWRQTWTRPIPVTMTARDGDVVLTESVWVE